MAEKKTFPRNMSGLVRGIGPVTAVLITVAYTVGASWQRQIFAFTGHAPISENLWFAGIPPSVTAFVIGGIIVLVMALGYSVLISAMPRSGGGYVVISRIISPFAGFIASWFEFLAITMGFGIIAVAVLEHVFYTYGPATGITTIPASYNDVGILAGSVLIIVFVTAIAASGVRITSYVLQALVWIPAGLSLYFFYLLGVAIANPSVLQNGISVWAQAHGVAGVTAETYVKAALAQGLDAANVGNYWTAVSASLLAAYFAYISAGSYAGLTFVAGEVKDPNRNFPKLILIAPIIVMIMFVAMAAFGAYSTAAVGQTTLPNGDKWSFLEAYSYLSFGGGSLRQAGLPNIRLFAATIASMVGMGFGLGSLNILIFLFSILWIVNDLPPMVLAASRIMFAMSFDRVLPASLSRVSGRFHTPLYATFLIGVVGMLGALSETCIVCNGGSWGPGGTVGDILTSVFSNGFYNTDLFDVVFFSFFALALVLFPFRQRRFFEEARFRPGGKLGVVSIGVAGLVANLVIGWLVLISPQDAYNILAPTSDNWFALGFTGLLGLIGCLIYAYYRYGPHRKETDYSAIFSEIPPE